jgi:hypothetical protein
LYLYIEIKSLISKKKIKSWPFILDMDQICLKFILRKLDMYIQKKVL